MIYDLHDEKNLKIFIPIMNENVDILWQIVLRETSQDQK